MKKNGIASCIFYTPNVSGKVQCLREKEKKKLKQRRHQRGSRKGRCVYPSIMGKICQAS